VTENGCYVRYALFIQSLVPEHAELFLLLSMVIPIPWLERVPTYKGTAYPRDAVHNHSILSPAELFVKTSENQQLSRTPPRAFWNPSSPG
jgi:tryptophanyl-tRNA synthetase